VPFRRSSISRRRSDARQIDRRQFHSRFGQ
jgi:hypothetical protein